MPKVKIVPNPAYESGHVNRLLSIVAPGPVALERDGSVVVKLSDQQLEDFYRKGGSAHRVEFLEIPPRPPAGDLAT